MGDRTDNSLDTMERHGSPVETPLHCHLKPPHSQASGLTQTSVEGDLPLLTLAVISAPARETATRLPAISVHVPIAGPPRFILFGSFRS